MRQRLDVSNGTCKKRGVIPSTSSGVLLSATLLGNATSSDRPSSFTIQLYKIFIFLVPFLSPYLPPSPSAFINRQPDSDLGPDLTGGKGGARDGGNAVEEKGSGPGRMLGYPGKAGPFSSLRFAAYNKDQQKRAAEAKAAARPGSASTGAGASAEEPPAKKKARTTEYTQRLWAGNMR